MTPKSKWQKLQLAMSVGRPLYTKLRKFLLIVVAANLCFFFLYVAVDATLILFGCTHHILMYQTIHVANGSENHFDNHEYKAQTLFHYFAPYVGNRFFFVTWSAMCCWARTHNRTHTYSITQYENAFASQTNLCNPVNMRFNCCVRLKKK